MVQSPLFRWKLILHLIWKSRSGVWRKSGEAQNPSCLKSSVKFPQSVMIWAAMSSAGVGPLCFLHSPEFTVNADIYQEMLEHLMLPSADKHLWKCWFYFLAGLGTCPHCQRYQKLFQWPWCYCAWLASNLNWPEPHRESMGYCQEEVVRHLTQQCRWPEGRYQSNLCFHYTRAVPQADHLDATPHWCMFMQKKPLPSIECIEMNILFRSLIFLFKISFFWLILCNILIETRNFGFSLSVSHNHQNVKK